MVSTHPPVFAGAVDGAYYAIFEAASLHLVGAVNEPSGVANLPGKHLGGDDVLVVTKSRVCAYLIPHESVIFH